MRQNKPHLKALTGLRIFAAVHVLFSHFANGLIARDADFWSEKARHDGSLWNHTVAGLLRIASNSVGCGSASVALFFVLSGFILAYNYLDPANPRRTARREFWLARVARVYPIYVLAWIIAAASALQHVREPGKSFVEKVALAPLSLLALHAWVPAWALDWNSPSWSLCTEALFYAVFPLIFLAGGAMRLSPALESRGGLTAKLALWLGLAVALPTLYLLTDPDHFGHWAVRHLRLLPADNSRAWVYFISYMPLLRLPELIAGVMLGKLFLIDVREGRQLPKWLLPVSVVLALGTYAAEPYLPVYYYTSGGTAPIFALLLYSMAHGGALASAISGRTLVLLGEASYGLYILHVPIAGFYRMALKKLHPEWFAHTSGEFARTPNWTYFTIYAVLTLAVSILTFKYFETPARGIIRDLFSKKKANPITPLPQRIAA